MRILSERNFEIDIEAVISSLLLHGLLDVGLQDSARGVLRRWDWLCLPGPESVWLSEAFDAAKQFQAQPTSATKHGNILDCLHKLRFHAHWELMSSEQIQHFKTRVAQFAVWCMQNLVPDTPENRYVGDTACWVLFNLVVSCMQYEDNHLIETDWCFLVNLGVGPLWTRFSVGSNSDEVDFEWLAVRLEWKPAPSNKRGRAAGGSA